MTLLYLHYPLVLQYSCGKSPLMRKSTKPMAIFHFANCQSLPDGLFPIKSHEITIFLWFSYGFPMVFRWFSHELVITRGYSRGAHPPGSSSKQRLGRCGGSTCSISIGPQNVWENTEIILIDSTFIYSV